MRFDVECPDFDPAMHELHRGVPRLWVAESGRCTYPFGREEIKGEYHAETIATPDPRVSSADD